MRKTAVAAVAVAGLLVVPGIASARTYKAFAGDPGPAPNGVPAGTTLNKFLPGSLKVRKGDSVRYTNFAAHTVSVLGRNVEVPPLILPDGTNTYAGILKADGSPFFFNGQQKFKYNEAVFGPVGDLNVNDTETHSTGFYTPGPGGPGVKTLKFGRVGRYQVLCLIHPGMKQTVRVLRKRAKGADKPAKVASRVTKQAAAGYRDARRAASKQAGANEVLAGVERKQATLLAFLPDTVTVPTGTTVTFTLDASSEVHNMVFTGLRGADGKGAAEDFAAAHLQATDLIPGLAPNGENQFAPANVYGTEPPGADGAYAYNGANAGNGLLITPLMDGQPGDPPQGLVGSEKVTFTAPGTYGYYCAIHGTAMAGTVIVQ
jgi:plastocyanin